MKEGPPARLVELFREVCALEGASREELIARVRRDDPELARNLEQLLEWDSSEVGIPMESLELAVRDGSDSQGGPEAGDRELLDKLARHTPPASRYQVKAELARGGMGAILEVRDVDLQRELAMKVVLGPTGEAPSRSSGRDARNLARLLDEARVTGQMNHPGVVPVHELGLDPTRGVYFTMQLVRGRDLGKVFRLAREGKEGWTQVRAIGVLLRACETMSYAHAKGVIHRDLKPANIMVGRYGEVYVMDWGLAKVQGLADRRDLRLQTAGEGSAPAEEAGEAGEPDEDDRADEPLRTMDGAVIGTPAYMPIEQAEGRIAELGPRSDVYSMGAMLYELLSGRPPYSRPGTRLSPRTVLAMLLMRPPSPLHTLDPGVPPELEAICEKAMTRDPRERYADTSAMAEDLQAWLEGRVVRAHRTGALIELTKWVRRNRGLASALGAVAGLLVVGLVVSLLLMAQAEAERRRAAEERANVLRLSAFQDLEDLKEESRALWPVHPERAGDYADWLDRADALLAGLHPDDESIGHYAQLAELRARVAAPAETSEGTPGGAAGGEEGERGEAARAEAWWLAQLEKLVRELEAFGDEEDGLTGRGVSPEWGWGMRRRLEFASTLAERTTTGPEARRLWDEAVAAVRADPRYGALELAPQLGLLPLGADPGSGLQEFAHVLSGDVPGRGANGHVVVTETSGVVLVLLPGGRFRMGCQKDDPAAPNHSPIVDPDEGPVHEVALAPFFLSKFELTQGQWLGFKGKNPSAYPPSYTFGDKQHDLRHPVENVSWSDAAAVLEQMGLHLPTEAQWEYAARAGTTSTWWFGEDETECATTANVLDAYSRDHGGPAGFPYEDWSDGYNAHAPVGTFRANGFGLHDVCGNVWEWCRDRYGPYTLPVAPGDGLRLETEAENRVARGGGFTFIAEQARSANRYEAPPDVPVFHLGFRPARGLE